MKLRISLFDFSGEISVDIGQTEEGTQHAAKLQLSVRA